MRTKSILIASAFFLSIIPAAVNAQFNKGHIMVEGGLGSLDIENFETKYEQNGVVTSKYKYNDFSIRIFPRMGYFINGNFVVGTAFGLTFSTGKFKDFDPVSGIKRNESKSNSLSLDLVPFVRYYFPGKKTSTRFYAQIGGGMTLNLSSKSETKYLDNSGNVIGTSRYNYPKKYNSFGAEAWVGINHFIAQNVALNAAMGYSYMSNRQTTSSTTTMNGVSTTTDPIKYTNKGGVIVWNIGFTMVVPCKKKK